MVLKVSRVCIEATYLESQGDVVSRLIKRTTGVLRWVLGVYVLSPPDPRRRRP